MNVLLFSGGIDSTALAYWKRPDQLLFIDYGQLSAEAEHRAAVQIAKDLNLPLDVKAADCRSFGSGDMAGLPSISKRASEFWPFRNQLLITLAAMAYASVSPLTVMIGSVRSDKVHPDGNPRFLEGMQDLLRAQGETQVKAPALGLTSKSLIKKSGVPLDVLAWAFSCHRGSQACGQCRGCMKHFETLAQLKEQTAVTN